MRLRNAIITLTQSILRSLQGANDTANPPTITCSIEDICAFGGFKGQDPDQSFRYLSSMFRDWSRSLITFFDSDSSPRFSCMLVSFISSSTCLHKLRLLGRCVSTPIARHIFPCRLILLGQIEREMGSAGFIITYMAAGIFGYVNPFYISTLERADGGDTKKRSRWKLCSSGSTVSWCIWRNLRNVRCQCPSLPENTLLCPLMIRLQ